MLALNRQLVADFQEASQIVAFFDKWEERLRTKLDIKCALLAQGFDDPALRNAVIERFMALGKRHFQ